MMTLNPHDRPSFDEIREEMGKFELPQEERLPLVIPSMDAEFYERDFVILNKIA